MIGQDIDVEKIPRDSLGVKFLARVYSPFVWEGDQNTCCDLPRQLTKLHTTVALGFKVTPIMKLLEKLRAYWLTDSWTPILGDLCVRAKFLLNQDFPKDDACAPMRAWNSELPRDVQYMNERADWMMEYVHKVLPGADVKRFLLWLEQTQGLEDLLSPVMLQEESVAKPSEPVVLNEQIVPVTPIVKPDDKKSAQAKPKMTAEEFASWKAERISKGLWKEKTVRERVKKIEDKGKDKGKDVAGAKPASKNVGPLSLAEQREAAKAAGKSAAAPRLVQ